MGSLLPEPIIQKLKIGEKTRPEVFDSASIFFCDIVSFTNISSVSTAHQIIDLLNDLYQMFDDRIDDYDVYKVETIGDAYMVASGVPIPNGQHHAVEIGKMALDLLAKVLTFEIKHKPNHRLKLRMGLHSGQVGESSGEGDEVMFVFWFRLLVEWLVPRSLTTLFLVTPLRLLLLWRVPDNQ